MSYRCLLVVGDEKGATGGLCDFAQRLLPGFNVVSATSAEAALKLLQDCPVDAILSDLCVPGMDGIEFLRRAAIFQPHAARILCTGEDAASWVLAAVNDGRANHVFSKPIDPLRFANALASCFTQLDCPEIWGVGS